MQHDACFKQNPRVTEQTNLCITNDPCQHPEIKALNPILEDLLMTQNLSQMNFKPTRHQVGCKSSLLDLFISNIPEMITNIKKFLNTMSEHEGGKRTIHTKTLIKH